jgi:hypothetical protein
MKKVLKKIVFSLLQGHLLIDGDRDRGKYRLRSICLCDSDPERFTPKNLPQLSRQDEFNFI